MVQSLVLICIFYGQHIAYILYYTNQGAVSFVTLASGAELLIRKCIAIFAIRNLSSHSGQSQGKRFCMCFMLLEQV
jgi:hypothetical protein